MTINKKSNDWQPEPATFDSLVMAAKQGDADAMNTILGQCRNYLLLIANQDLPDALQAKLGASDLVQETLLAAHQNFQQFRGESAEELNGWLRQILCNELYSAGRRFTGTKKRRADREHWLNDSRIEQPPLADSLNTPGATALQSEEERLLAAAMAKLPDTYQQAIRLRNWDKLKFDEIGLRMGMSGEAARKIWSRAIFKLESLLAELGIDWKEE